MPQIGISINRKNGDFLVIDNDQNEVASVKTGISKLLAWHTETYSSSLGGECFAIFINSHR